VVNLDTKNSSGTFGFQQAAVRAIRSSNPFPPLPEEFAKQSLEFSVDLMEKE
jgi:outer membrane biosynthesis protein TonB